MKSSRKSLLCVFAEEMHAEICYAECLLQKATLTFVQVRSAVCRLSAPLTVYLIIIIIIIIISFNNNVRLKKSNIIVKIIKQYSKCNRSIFPGLTDLLEVTRSFYSFRSLKFGTKHKKISVWLPKLSVLWKFICLLKIFF